MFNSATGAREYVDRLYSGYIVHNDYGPVNNVGMLVSLDTAPSQENKEQITITWSTKYICKPRSGVLSSTYHVMSKQYLSQDS